MNYGQVLELDNITPNQCDDAFRLRGMSVIINDGRILDFLDKDEKENDFWNIKNENGGNQNW